MNRLIFNSRPISRLFFPLSASFINFVRSAIFCGVLRRLSSFSNSSRSDLLRVYDFGANCAILSFLVSVVSVISLSPSLP